MGVMACCREECTNIMCNHYSRDYGYICDDCLDELNTYCLQHGVTPQSIEEFMGTPKRKAIQPTDSVYDIFSDGK